MEGDLMWGGDHTILYNIHMMQNCTPETYVILLANVTQIDSIKINKKTIVVFPTGVQNFSFYHKFCPVIQEKGLENAQRPKEQ